MCPILDYARFERGAKALYEKIKENGAQFVFYQTWGRKTGSGDLASLKLTNESMTRALAEAYQKLGAELNVPVSPVGTVFYEIYTANPEIELYHEDMTHPSPVGTYLAALCHFTVVAGESPEKVTYRAGIDEAQAIVLKKAVSDAIFRV